MATLLVELTGSLESVRSLMATAGAEIPCRPVAVRAAQGVRVQALLDSAAVEAARAVRADVSIDVLRDLDAAGAAARALVSPGTRYSARGDLPRGVGRKE